MENKGNNKITELQTILPNSKQSYKGKVQTHKYINRQNQSTTGKHESLLFGIKFKKKAFLL
jgi:hypothetical protein